MVRKIECHVPDGTAHTELTRTNRQDLLLFLFALLEFKLGTLCLLGRSSTA